jgi:MFS family permease
MRIALVIAGSGLLVIGVSERLWVTAVGMILAGTGTFGFVPVLQAYLSARLPIRRRARGLGIMEYGWALAGIFGLYGFGFLIERTSWRVPFYIMGGVFLVGGAVVRLFPQFRAG